MSEESIELLLRLGVLGSAVVVAVTMLTVRAASSQRWSWDCARWLPARSGWPSLTAAEAIG
jgi:hypothetical protein